MSTGLEDPGGQIADLVLNVYEIDDEVIARTGGLPGLRDAQMLHAACARPFASFAGQPLYATEFEQAGALFHSLIRPRQLPAKTCFHRHHHRADGRGPARVARLTRTPPETGVLIGLITVVCRRAS